MSEFLYLFQASMNVEVHDHRSLLASVRLHFKFAQNLKKKIKTILKAAYLFY
jgi:hypothetical protein